MIDFKSKNSDTLMKLASNHLKFIKKKYEYAIAVAAGSVMRTFEGDSVDDEDVCLVVDDSVKVHIVSETPSELLFSLKGKDLKMIIEWVLNGCEAEGSNRHRGIIVPINYEYSSGQFLNGGTTEVALLCHTSTLYPVLEQLRTGRITAMMRSKNLVNRYLYRDDVSTIGDVLFFDYTEELIKDDRESGESTLHVAGIRSANVILCTPPDYDLFIRRATFVEEESWEDIQRELDQVIRERIDAVLYAAFRKGLIELIIGAFGAEFSSWMKKGSTLPTPDFPGVDVSVDEVRSTILKIVANAFSELLADKYSTCFERVWFALSDEEARNVFKDAMGANLKEGGYYYEQSDRVS